MHVYVLRPFLKTGRQRNWHRNKPQQDLLGFALFFPVKLNSEIVELAEVSRHRVCSRSILLQIPCNIEDAVKAAILKGTNFKIILYVLCFLLAI